MFVTNDDMDAEDRPDIQREDWNRDVAEKRWLEEEQKRGDAMDVEKSEWKIKYLGK